MPVEFNLRQGQASLAGLEDVSSQSCGRHRRDGPVRCADGVVPAALWAFDREPQPSADRVAWRHGASNGGVAGQPTHTGLRLGPGTVVPDPRPGCLLRQHIRSSGSISGHPRSPDVSTSPWQNGFAERLIGSIRRECLDHVVVFGEHHLRHVLTCYMDYYNAVRTYLSLGKDTPHRRPVQLAGRIQARPIIGGLHHQYVRI